MVVNLRPSHLPASDWRPSLSGGADGGGEWGAAAGDLGD